ncbi:hypothetical protein [Desertibaculum subflavum]|uniref:hypothetical protein n=1 Tax=Desertibaculum subflavum TaxID=2268458 RepID=UPI0013C48675
MDGTEAGHRHRAVAAPPVVASVLSAGAGARLAVVAGLIALLWLAVWWALSP